jgi:dihydrodipicolinate synthase/N-acetylneuraminate lyase
VNLTAAAKEIGCEGTLLLPPPYVMPTDRELVAYISAVDEVGLPMMLYNNPVRTGVNLDASRLSKLMPMRNVVALKDSVKDLSQLSATLRAWRSELAVFVGFEAYVVPCVQRGAVGVVGMAPNVLGAQAVALFRKAISGDWKGLEQLQETIDLLYDRMYSWNNNPYVVAKEAMRLLGRPGGWPRPPLLSMEDQDREVLRHFLHDIGALTRAVAE